VPEGGNVTPEPFVAKSTAGRSRRARSSRRTHRGDRQEIALLQPVWSSNRNAIVVTVDARRARA